MIGTQRASNISSFVSLSLSLSLSVSRSLDFRTGYESVLFIRPELTQILLSRVPASKILLNKQVVDIDDNPEEELVTVHCADASSYKASILIGADGTYSNVRQSLYKTLGEKGVLPKDDTKELEVGFACIVGTTGPMDPEKYPVLKDDYGHFDSIIGGVRHNVRLSKEMERATKKSRPIHLDLTFFCVLSYIQTKSGALVTSPTTDSRGG